MNLRLSTPRRETFLVSIIIAALSNTVVKAAMAGFIGSADYRRPMLIATALIAAVGLGAILFDLLRA